MSDGERSGRIDYGEHNDEERKGDRKSARTNVCSVLQLSVLNTKQKKNAVLLIFSVSPRWSECVCKKSKECVLFVYVREFCMCVFFINTSNVQYTGSFRLRAYL